MHSKTKWKTLSTFTLVSAIIAGCGGGGDSQPNESVNAQPRILIDSDWASARAINSNSSSNISASVIGSNLNLSIESDFLENAPHVQVYLDTDNNATTGFQFENQAWANSGVDYIIEDGFLYKSLTSNTEWNWDTDAGDISYETSNKNIDISIDTGLLGDVCNTVNIGLMTRDNGWSVENFYPISANMSTFSVSYCANSNADNEKPEITINGSNPLNLALNATYTELGASAYDNRDGNISSNITSSTNLDTSVAGTYSVTYSVSDAAGNNATKTRTVIVSESNTASSITIDGDTSDWAAIPALYSTDKGIVKVTDDQNKLYLLADVSFLDTNSQFFIDTDNNASTGLRLNIVKESWVAGVDYMIENNSLDRFSGNTQTIWAWDYNTAPLEFIRTTNTIEVAINKADLENLGQEIIVGFNARDKDWNSNYTIPDGALKQYTLGSTAVDPVDPIDPVDPVDPIEPVEPVDPVVSSARYRLTFNSIWSIDTHPVNFPAFNPHFSPLVGAVHNSELVLWNRGEVASEGMEIMAETGGTGALISEILNADAQNDSVLSEINGSPIPFSPGSTSLEFDITPDFPEVTFVSMLAPSPDWFIGIHNLNLFENGTFVPSKTVSLNVYDAGTDSGLRFTSGDIDTQPKEAISLLTTDADDTSFISGQPAIGTFTFERISITEE